MEDQQGVMRGFETPPHDGIALALSGGGFRATLYHCGALIRLNELGLLSRIDQFGSVSGGSIILGRLASVWDRLEFNENGVAHNLVPLVIDPVRAFCSRNQDRRVVFRRLLSPFSHIGAKLASVYEDLTEGKHLEHLPSHPEFVFKSTNFQTGSMVRFSQLMIAELRLGAIDRPKGIPISTVMAASSAYPPVFSPIRVDTSHCKWREFGGGQLGADQSFSGMLVLADGGVHDNLGLRGTIAFKTALVSDAGSPFAFDTKRKTPILYQLRRTMSIISEQARAARSELLARREHSGVNDVAYWSIDRSYDGSEAKDRLPVAAAVVHRLSRMRTRLNRFTEREQGELINWGYASCDFSIGDAIAVPQDAPVARWPMPQQRFEFS